MNNSLRPVPLHWPALLVATLVATASVNTPARADTSPYEVQAQGSRCVGSEGRDSAGKSAVDDREIRWTEETKYDDARKHSNRAWSSHGLEQVAIRADVWNTSNDLIWKDKNKGDGALATYSRNPNLGKTDVIHMNDYYLKAGRPGDWDSTVWRRFAAAHEFGHALGLCHKNPDQGATIMTANARYAADNKPTRRDRGDYHKIWGN
ncbi:hypothetical protein AB0J38_28220 [Streptomyces sp. NPDC050095]|uniref:hypothetical protein n=1 Tax=unclassified Streptomyces TaxID=2593676 RepID=UPI0034206A4A